MPRTTTTRTGRPYTGSLRIDIPPTATMPGPLSPDLGPTIQGLLTPGLVPDIARQSAEVSAGRGIAGSPAADSTAVKMSEQNYLQRLGVANALLSGEAGRSLPYQITPFQSIQTALQQQALQNARDIAQLHYSSFRPSGGGQAPAGVTGNTPWAGFINQPFIGQQPVPTGDFHGTGPEGGSTMFGNNWSIDEILSSLGLGGDFEPTEAPGFPYLE
jgi:hypothetical protein